MLMATLMQSGGKKAGPQLLSSAGQWGMRVEKADDDEEAGVTVAEAFPGGAADKSGLKAGDRLLTLDGRWTDTVADCYRAAAEIKPGQPAELVLKRDGKEVKRMVSPAEGF